MRTVSVLGVMCEVLQSPVPSHIAHPGDDEESYDCMMCALVRRPDTGEHVLVWGFNQTDDYSISRQDPKCEYHNRTWPKKLDGALTT